MIVSVGEVNLSLANAVDSVLLLSSSAGQTDDLSLLLRRPPGRSFSSSYQEDHEGWCVVRLILEGEEAHSGVSRLAMFV